MKTSARTGTEPLIWGSADETAEPTADAATVGEFPLTKVPARIFYPRALAAAAAFALLAAALGLGPERVKSEPMLPTETPILLRVGPAAGAHSTMSASPSTVSSAAIGEDWTAEETPRMRLGEVFPSVAAIGMLAVALETFRRHRRHRRRRKLRLQALYEPMQSPDDWIETPAPPELGEAPRFLPSNPYREPARPDRLGRQIESAAQASLDFGRVLGVIYFDLGDPPVDGDGGPVVEWTESAAELVFNLQGVLRPTDHVALVDDRRLVVCIALLPGKTELIGIGERVRRAGQNSPAFAAAFARQAGLSMFPVCGYRGEELIDYAHMDYDIRNAMPATAPPRLEVKLEPASQGES